MAVGEAAIRRPDIPAQVEVAVMFISALSHSQTQLPSLLTLVLAERLVAQIPRAETAKLLLRLELEFQFLLAVALVAQAVIADAARVEIVVAI